MKDVVFDRLEEIPLVKELRSEVGVYEKEV